MFVEPCIPRRCRPVGARHGLWLMFALAACAAPHPVIPAAAAFADDPSIRVVRNSDGKPVAFEMLSLPAPVLADLARRTADDDVFRALFAVRVADRNRADDSPGMLGTYAVSGSVVRFTPRYPLRPGLKYRAVLRLSAGQDAGNPAEGRDPGAIVLELTIPDARQHLPTEVLQVYPSAAVLPENQLRFYVRFSTPMSRGDAYEHLRLLRADGRPVDLPFLELGEELWDIEGKRLTLLIDPGRIKRGVKPLEDLGPVLEAGQSFTLVVDSGWNDAAGRPLAKEFRKQFRVAEPLRTAIDPADWKISVPRQGTNGTLVVTFPRALDHALLERTLEVRGPSGTRIAGRGTIGTEERRWEFHPDRPWPAGGYRLRVDTTLEDPCGNRIGAPFEADALGTISKRILPATVDVPFAIPDGAVTP